MVRNLETAEEVDVSVAEAWWLMSRFIQSLVNRGYMLTWPRSADNSRSWTGVLLVLQELQDLQDLVLQDLVLQELVLLHGLVLQELVLLHGMVLQELVLQVWSAARETGFLKEQLIFCKSVWLLYRLVVPAKSYYPGKDRKWEDQSWSSGDFLKKLLKSRWWLS